MAQRSDLSGDRLPVTLVVAPRFSLLSLSICLDGLRIANRESVTPRFDWILASVDGGPVASSSGLVVQPQAAITEVARSPVTIVLTAYEPEAACRPALLAWLRRQDRAGGIIGCVDTAALVLGRAGLLTDSKIAVHHEVVAPFREELGDAVLLDRTWAFQGRRLSSAGGVATLDMLLGLIEHIRDRALAQRVAQVMNFDWPQDRAQPQADDLGGSLFRIDRRLSRIVALMQSSLEAPIPLATICLEARVDASTMRRLFRRHLKKSPSAYYLGLRLDRARTLLRYSHLSIAEIAAAVGFADGASFTHAFTRVMGHAPSRDRSDRSGL